MEAGSCTMIRLRKGQNCTTESFRASADTHAGCAAVNGKENRGQGSPDASARVPEVRPCRRAAQHRSHHQGLGHTLLAHPVSCSVVLDAATDVVDAQHTSSHTRCTSECAEVTVICQSLESSSAPSSPCR